MRLYANGKLLTRQATEAVAVETLRKEKRYAAEVRLHGERRQFGFWHDGASWVFEVLAGKEGEFALFLTDRQAEAAIRQIFKGNIPTEATIGPTILGVYEVVRMRPRC